MKMTYQFKSSESPEISQVGGKALALIIMTREGMTVPPGFVLTVEFFEPWIIALKAAPEWKAIQNCSKDELGQATRAIKSLCRDLRYSRQQQEDLNMALESFRTSYNAELFAVRSSSPDEDLEGASFAGGYETTLGVTEDRIKEAILHSFISSFDERVFLYKKEHGFSTDQPRIAVIVQQQVDADCAGVAFSLNPVNNCFDEAVINANYGLGESVVAGEVEPDVFVVDKLNRKIIDTKVGSKEVITKLNPNGGTTKSSQNSNHQACITPTQVLELANLLDKVESYYQKPVDIEWAISHDKLFLLQVRPITTYLPLPQEMVTAPHEPKRLYADATLIEQGIQEPLSVLGIDFINYVLKQMTKTFGEDSFGINGTVFTAGGRYYLHLSNSIKMLGMNAPMAPGSMNDTSVKEILKSIDLKQYTQYKLPAKLKTAKYKQIITVIPMLISSLKVYRKPGAFLQKYQQKLPAQLQRLKDISNKADSFTIKQLSINLTDCLDFFFLGYGLPMFAVPQIAQYQIKRMFRKEADIVHDELASLSISLPGNKTAEMGEMMYNLASFEEIKDCPSAEEFNIRLKNETVSPAFLQRWNQFMEEFGFRCPREIDVATPRPGEQPGLIFNQIKNLSLSINTRKGSKTIFEEARLKRETAYQILYGIASKKGKRKAKAFEKYYETIITLGGHRETPKHYVTMVVYLFRKRILQVAQDIVNNNRLDYPDQIFDLTIDDIDKALVDPLLDLRALAIERTKILNRIKRSHLIARVIDSRGRIYYPPRKDAKAGELVGMSISPGIVQGKVKVLRRPDEKKILPGEILVTRATDPGWTPLFINAKGIILEIGGPLQHGAIVAREYGIPCVSGIDGVVDKFKDGQLVEVDGSNGVVRILEQDPDGKTSSVN